MTPAALVGYALVTVGAVGFAGGWWLREWVQRWIERG